MPKLHSLLTVVIYLGVSCFIISLLLPALYTSEGDIGGLWVLLTGWMGLVFFQFSWYANPLNLLAMLLVNKQSGISILLSTLAFIIASETFIFDEIPTGINLQKTYIKELGLGFYIWYLAQSLFLCAALIRYLGLKIK